MKHASKPIERAGNPLEVLGLREVNAGAWSGSHGWSTETSGAIIESTNPATGKRLAQVRSATMRDYEHVMSAACAAAAVWRGVPAPKRGEAVRLEVAQATELSQISPEQFPETDATRAALRPTGSQRFVYRFSGVDFRLRLQAEQKKFQLGISQLRFVLDEQRNLADAETTEVAALVSYSQSLVAYDRAVGRTLRKNNIQIDKIAGTRGQTPQSLVGGR